MPQLLRAAAGRTTTDTLGTMPAAGLIQGSAARKVGPSDIGFPFKYYENVRSQLFISRYGVVAFNTDALSDDQSRIPNPSKPNDVIAPHWVPVSSIAGYVRYLRGGAAPNRWFAVEWNRLQSNCCSGDGAEEYTFEAILHESGDIVFQCGAMVRNGGYYCQSSGIEDGAGLDGLSITSFCSLVAGDHAVRISRPAPAQGVTLSPKVSGAFAAPGGVASLSQVIRNTGELGADTYDLFPPAGWALYGPDGATPLADTDGDGAPASGRSASEGWRRSSSRWPFPPARPLATIRRPDPRTVVARSRPPCPAQTARPGRPGCSPTGPAAGSSTAPRCPAQCFRSASPGRAGSPGRS